MKRFIKLGLPVAALLVSSGCFVFWTGCPGGYRWDYIDKGDGYYDGLGGNAISPLSGLPYGGWVFGATGMGGHMPGLYCCDTESGLCSGGPIYTFEDLFYCVVFAGVPIFDCGDCQALPWDFSEDAPVGRAAVTIGGAEFQFGKQTVGYAYRTPAGGTSIVVRDPETEYAIFAATHPQAEAMTGVYLANEAFTTWKAAGAPIEFNVVDENGSATGSFSGKLVDADGNVHDLSASFSVKLVVAE